MNLPEGSEGVTSNAPECALISSLTSRPVFSSSQHLTRHQDLCSRFNPCPQSIESPMTSIRNGSSAEGFSLWGQTAAALTALKQMIKPKAAKSSGSFSEDE
jgi:hypothetical protein